MTADEKIKESTYNLIELKSADRWSEIYMYKFNSFITSARSILDHLLDDYAIKYNLSIPVDTTNNLRTEFHKCAKANADAEKFIKWYDQEYHNIVKDPTYGFLLKKRNIILHRKTVKPNKFIIGMEFPQGATMASTTGPTYIPVMIPQNATKVPITTVDQKTGEKKVSEVEAKPILEPYLAENPSRTIQEICELLLATLRLMVSYAHSNF